MRIRDLREAHNPPLTQEQLAARAGLTSKTVARIETQGGGKIETLRAIARALDVPLDALYADEVSA